MAPAIPAAGVAEIATDRVYRLPAKTEDYVLTVEEHWVTCSLTPSESYWLKIFFFLFLPLVY